MQDALSFHTYQQTSEDSLYSLIYKPTNSEHLKFRPIRINNKSGKSGQA